jgi:large repetitive protein
VDGKPTTGGTFTFTLQASDGRVRDTQQYEMVITGSTLSIVTSSLPDADVGTPYSVFLVRAGGVGPFTWDLISGSLPSGISISAEGELAGTPTAVGDASFEVRVRDAGNQSATPGLTLHVDP